MPGWVVAIPLGAPCAPFHPEKADLPDQCDLRTMALMIKGLVKFHAYLLSLLWLIASSA